MTNPSASTLTVSPVRIYVLWHREFTDGRRLARRIYHWFRIETGEGIPVFFRSSNALGGDEPPEIPKDCGINYLIPLIEENMVACPRWRRYVSDLTSAVGDGGKAAALPENRVFPVALDPVSYQMPPMLRRLNFIRHIRSDDSPPDDEALLSRLTEVLCRDLRDLLHHRAGAIAGAVPEKLKIFLSHAKADGTETPIRLKEYIQGQTQCEAFFDENDIPSGYDYANVLETAIREDSAGLIVVQGDHYADRPWCRKEIRDFLKPQRERTPNGSGSPNAGSPAYFTPPVVMVQNMAGRKLARSIPELGHAPCLQWVEGAERRIITTLIREVLLGLFYREIARQFAKTEERGTVYLNRTPDPVLLQRVLSDLAEPGGQPCKRFVHPGYGLSRMDRTGLEAAFRGVAFESFSEMSADQDVLEPVAERIRQQKPVLAVSAGNATDILASGAGDEHNKELLLRLLRPLFRLQCSLLYGGSAPTVQHDRPPWDVELNFTDLFLYLLMSEREEDDGSLSRLYNLSAWPFCSRIDRKLIARWTDICSFVTVTEADAGIPESLRLPTEEEKGNPTRRAVNQALCLSEMRRRAVGTFPCTLPDGGGQTCGVSAMAHIFLGGKTVYSSGIIPGVLEEILYALDAKKPVYLIGAGMGAAGLVARWLDPEQAPKSRPPELTPEYYLGDRNFAAVHTELQKLEPRPETAESALDRLWEYARRAASEGGLSGLLNNGLDDRDNRCLLTSQNYAEIVKLVHRGIAALFSAEPAGRHSSEAAEAVRET